MRLQKPIRLVVEGVVPLRHIPGIVVEQIPEHVAAGWICYFGPYRWKIVGIDHGASVISVHVEVDDWLPDKNDFLYVIPPE